MTFKVIRVEDFELDLKKAYKSFSEQADIFWDLDYLLKNSLHEDGESWIALLIEEKNIKAAFPFVKRKMHYKEHCFFDIVTPYEYGGLLVNPSNEELVEIFDAKFVNYCLSENIVCEFRRINPFLKDQCGFISDLIRRKANDNIYVDLNKTEEDIFSSYHKNNRRDIRIALKNEVKVICHAPSESSIAIFMNIYRSTMDAKNADQYYYFSEEYFEGLKKMSSDHLKVFVAYSADGSPISSALVLTKGIHSHYHLSGTDRAFSKLCGNNLLLHTVILMMKELGCQFFHLGGAAGSQKGLYQFKKRFSEKTIEYFTAHRIFNNYFYHKINKQIIAENNLNESLLEDNYFPLYRLLKKNINE